MTIWNIFGMEKDSMKFSTAIFKLWRILQFWAHIICIMNAAKWRTCSSIFYLNCKFLFIHLLHGILDARVSWVSNFKCSEWHLNKQKCERLPLFMNENFHSKSLHVARVMCFNGRKTNISVYFMNLSLTFWWFSNEHCKWKWSTYSLDTDCSSQFVSAFGKISMLLKRILTHFFSFNFFSSSFFSRLSV